MQELIEVLSKSLLFKNLDQSSIERILDELSGNKKVLKKNSILFSEGDRVESLCFVLSGKLQLVKYSYMGQKSIVVTLKKGDFFAEALAFSKTKISPVTVEAITDCEIFFISVEDLLQNEVIDEWRKRLLLNLLEMSFEKSFALNKKIDILSQRTIRDKLLTYLDFERKAYKSNTIKLQHTKQALANYLEVDRTALFRVMKQLEDEGIITLDNKTITLN